MAARIDDIERRLLNWARWRLGGTAGGLGFASVNLEAALSARDDSRQSVVPTSDAEAVDTDAAVLALDSALRRTVEVVYLSGGGMAGKARKLACSEATVYSRVGQAHWQIAAWLADLATRRRAERERVERTMRAARPGGFTH